MRRVLLIVCLLVLAGHTGAADRPSGEDVIALVKRTYDAVNDYRVDVTLTVKSEMISIKDMRMTVYYKKPDKLHVEAKQGFAVVPTGTYLGNPMDELTRHAKPVYLKSAKKQGRNCHVIRLDPKSDVAAPKITVWVDAQRGVIVATEMSGPNRVKSVWRHAKIDGKYYLPVEITAEMPLAGKPWQQGTGKVTLKFANYRVNKGISDKVFQQKPRGK